MEGFAKVVDAIAHIISVVIWPILVFWVARHFSAEIKHLLLGLRKLGLKGFGLEASVEAQEEVAAALTAAENESKTQPMTAAITATEVIPPKIAAIDSVSSKFTTIKYLNKLKSSRVLWVDDNPSNNFFQRQAFQSAGIRVETARNTEEALTRLAGGWYNVIISDMARPPDMTAGYTLLAKLGEKHPPYVIFSSSADPKHDEEAKKNGALGSTNSATKLFELVATAIAEQS